MWFKKKKDKIILDDELIEHHNPDGSVGSSGTYDIFDPYKD